MKLHRALSNFSLISLIVILVVIILDFYKVFLPIYFVITLLIPYFFLSLVIIYCTAIYKDRRELLLVKIILLSIDLISGYADLYFKLSRTYTDVFKNDKVLSVIDSLYFSVTTFTTTGYGDIYPISNSAKMFVASEMIIGYILSMFTIVMLVVKIIGSNNINK